MTEMPMIDTARKECGDTAVSSLRISNLFRISDFGFRILPDSLVIFALQLATASADDIDDRLAQNAAQYTSQLEQLADWCDARQLTAEAKQTRGWRHDVPPFELVYYRPPIAAGSLLLDADVAASAETRDWHKQFAGLRKSQADALFGLAREALQGKRTSLAMLLVNHALRENPDHPAARRILGYQLHQQQWLTPFQAARQRAGQVWHDKYGWIPQRLVDRYAAGERYAKGRLISAEQDQRLHASIDTGWEIETEHFHLTTNHSLEAGARIGGLLEEAAEVWEQLLAGYVWSPVELARMFDGGPRPTAARRKHEVIVFRDEQQYRQALRGEIPEEVRTTGIYISRRRAAYFFVEPADASAKPDDSTLVHEGVHQLFSESRKPPPNIGREQNFWIIEGIACYFESLRVAPDRMTLGGASPLRLENARYRLLEEAFYVPLAELTAMGMNDLQRDPNIAKLYSQSAGLTHFLVHDQQGRYRDALVAYLSAVYSGRDRPSTLAELTGVEYGELDQQYRKFLEETAAATEKPTKE
jgi:tetratricopeptide (TPR) repeat protein